MIIAVTLCIKLIVYIWRMNKKPVTIVMRDVPEDIHALIVAEKARIEQATGRTATNPQAVYRLIRKG
jgi:hypothetical protein